MGGVYGTYRREKKLSALLTMVSVAKIIQRRLWMNEHAAFVEWYGLGKTEILGENPVPAPIRH